MTRARGRRSAALALTLLLLACGDAATAPNDASGTVRVALAGLATRDAGVLLRLTGPVDQIEAAEAALDVAWVPDGAGSATVVIVGPLSENADVIVVRRRAGSSVLRVEVQEIAGPDGAVSASTTARAIIRPTPAP